MYITGDKTNLEVRLHQLASSGSDVANFSVEGNSYGTGLTWPTVNKLNREFRHIVYEISGVSTTGNYILHSGINYQ